MALTRITKGVIKPNENYDTHNINSTGIVTAIGLDVNGNADVSGSLSVGGVLTYEDVTSIDSVGIITARAGVVSPNADIDDFVSVGSNIHLGNAGVVTATSFVGSGAALTGIDATAIKDSGGNVKVQAQASGAMYTGIHTFSSGAEVGSNIKLGNAGVITATSFVGSGAALTGIDATAIKDSAGNVKVQAQASGAVYTGIHTFGTNTNFTDIDVDGHTNLDNLNIAGVSTFAGTLNASTVSSTALIASGDLDVDGHTNLDNVSVAGVSTFTGNIDANGDLDVDGHTNLDNVSIAGVVTATSFSGSGANLTSLPAANLTGTLPAISGANLTGIDATAIKDSGGNVKIQAQASGAVYTGIHTFTNETHIVKAGSSSFLVGSTDAGGAIIALDGDSNGDGGGADYAFLQHNTDGDLVIVADNPSNASNIKFYTSNTSEKMSLTSQGQLKLSGNNTGNHMLGFGSNVGGLTIDDVGNQHTALEVQHGSNKFYNVCSSNNSNYISSYGTGNLVFEHTGAGGSRTRMQLLANGNVSIANTAIANQVKLNSTTTTIRNTGVSTAAGTMIYNSTLERLQVYADNAWQSFSGKTINTSGGTISNDAARSNYITHTFTSPGTFSTDGALEGVEIMVVGGGGGGGGHRYGSGGGAGGVIMRPGSSPTPAYPLSSPAPVVVGSGGAGSSSGGTGSSGSNSTFGTGPMTVIGYGGGGGTSYDGPVYPGRPGGSGGGGTSRASNSPGGSATQPGTHGAGTDYGNRGGNYTVPGGGWAPAGGGGAGGNGTDVPTNIPGGGNGAIGVQLSISGSATYYAGGGAGGIYNNQTGPNSYYGVGGNGGGGSSWNSVPGSYAGHSAPGAGAANSGGGGCGAHGQNPSSIPINNALSGGKAGGSGIVIVAYPTTQPEGDVNAI